MRKERRSAAKVSDDAPMRNGIRRGIIREIWDGLQGEPLDPEHPEQDFWLVVAMAIVPAYIVIDLVMFQ